MPTPLIPDLSVVQRKFATLPLATYQAGETVLSADSTTGRLLGATGTNLMYGT